MKTRNEINQKRFNIGMRLLSLRPGTEISILEFDNNKLLLTKIDDNIYEDVKGNEYNKSVIIDKIYMEEEKHKDKLKIKIIMDIPVEKENKPIVGKTYDVINIENSKSGLLYFIKEYKVKVGIFEHECEIIKN